MITAESANGCTRKKMQPMLKLWLLRNNSVVGMQHAVQGDGGLVGQALNGTSHRITDKQQVRLTRQLFAFYRSDCLTIFIKQRDFGAGSDVQAGFHGATVSQ